MQRETVARPAESGGLQWQSVLRGVGNWLVRTQEGILFLIVAALWVFLTLRSEVFLTERNINVLLSQVSMVAITAIGMTLLMIAGEVDLSVGSMQAFVGVVVMTVLNDTKSLPLGIAAGLGIGLVVGTLNAISRLQLGINALIGTLAMLNIVRGVAYWYTEAAVQNTHRMQSFKDLGNGFILGIPWPVVIFFSVFTIFYFVLTRTTFGRYVLAVGGNQRAAELAGVRAKLVKWLCFVLVSMLAALSAIILLSRLNSGQTNAGFGFELQVVGAVLLGGTSLYGGQGSLLGTLLAVLLLGTLNNGIILLNINSSWQIAITGFAILLSVFLDARRRKRIGES
jgi:ribose transport system permease protein